MRNVYFTVGPSQPHARLREFMDDAWEADVPAMSHRGGEFRTLYRRTEEALRELMGIPADYRVLFVGSATEGLERVVQGLVERRSLHLITGLFGEKWFKIAEQLGKEPAAVRAEPGEGLDVEALDLPADTELVCVTQNDTSTGVHWPDELLARIAELPGRPLVAVDAVSSAPISHLPWAGCDAVVFSVQKAFGLPAGLGVIVVSPRALARARELEARGVSVGSYASLPELERHANDFQTPPTPNVLGIYLLDRVARDLSDRGLAVARAENAERARALYGAIERNPHAEAYVRDPAWRSPTTIVVRVPGGSDGLHGHMQAGGHVVGRGYGRRKLDHVRIANFPTTSREQFDAMLAHLLEFGG
jgi:phosphoserine aminotransferase